MDKLNEGAITYIYEMLAKKTVELFDASVALADTKRRRDATANQYVLDGRVTGKNPVERDAQLARLMTKYDNWVTLAQRQYDRIKNELRLIEIDIERIRLIVRLMELDRPVSKDV